MIRAETHSDDMKVAVRFDATPWFEQASDDEIVALFKCELGGDYPADHVAQFFEGRSGYELVTHMFDYIHTVNRSSRETIGFECHVDEPNAAAWVLGNKPGLVPALLELGRYDDRTDLEIEAARTNTPYWDRDSSWVDHPYQVPATAPVPGV